MTFFPAKAFSSKPTNQIDWSDGRANENTPSSVYLRYAFARLVFQKFVQTSVPSAMESDPSELPHTRKVSFLRSQMVNPRTGKLYIFGYGSLIWKPNITYSRSWVGYIEGYHRRFYQGTTTHRGTPEWPGRVATLVPARNAHTRVWGVTYEIQGRRDIDAALEHLAEREMITGGYRFDEVDFVARKLTFATADSPEDEWSKDLTAESARLSVQVYIAEPGNPQYIGDAPLEVQAHQIAKATGNCGPNIEYLFRLVDFVRQEVPKEDLLFEKYLLDLNQLVEDYRSHRKSLPNGFSSEAARMSTDGSFNSSNDISLEKSINQRSDAFPSLRRQFSVPTRDSRRRDEKVRPVEVRVKAS